MEKTEEKKPISHISLNGKTNARRVMEVIYSFNKPLKVKEIMRNTGFSQIKVLTTLRFLASGRMITKEYEIFGGTKEAPPHRILIVRLTLSQFRRARRYLSH